MAISLESYLNSHTSYDNPTTQRREVTNTNSGELVAFIPKSTVDKMQRCIILKSYVLGQNTMVNVSEWHLI